MAYSIIAVLALFAVEITAISAPALTPTLSAVPMRTAAAHPKLPFPIAEMVWEGSLSNDDNVTIVGSIEKIATELEILEPGRSAVDPARVRQREPIEPRYPVGETCTLPQGYEYVYVERPFGVRPIEDGIRHLKNVGGGCGVGPNTCVRVSCSWNTAVYLCNNNGWGIAPACDYLGYEHLQWINDNCEFWGVECCPSAWVQVNGGIRYDSDNYSLWLLEEGC